jgi:spoIIIJ-associated protein
MGMSPFIEFESKNVEGAVTKACEALNISRDHLKHEVVCFGATGIFGLVGFKKARIRVTTPVISEVDVIDTPDKSSLMPDDLQNECREPEIPFVTNTDNCSALLPPSIDVCAVLGRQALQRLVDSVTSGAEIAVLCSSRQIVYTISGGDPAALIGKKGQTIEAIQYLLKRIVNKSTEIRAHIVVEIAGHAVKRQEELQSLAQRSAENACCNAKAVTVGRFSPQDRKTIHLALKNDIRVKTQSKGEGYQKKLLVIPR